MLVFEGSVFSRYYCEGIHSVPQGPGRKEGRKVRLVRLVSVDASTRGISSRYFVVAEGFTQCRSGISESDGG